MIEQAIRRWLARMLRPLLAYPMWLFLQLGGGGYMVPLPLHCGGWA